MQVHFFMISLRPIRHAQVSSKFFRRLRASGDLTLQKRLVLFLHHPHLKGWQRVHHSSSSIREGWHRSQSISFHIRGVRVSIRVSREILPRTYGHNDFKNNAHIHNPQFFHAKQTGQHDDAHMRTLILLRNLIHVRSLVCMRTWIHMKNLVHMKNLIWGSYSSQVVS